MEIHQLVPGLILGDALGDYAVEIRRILRSWGYASEIYAPRRHIHVSTSDLCHEYRTHGPRSSPENIAVYHFSVGSEMSGYFRTLPDRKILHYHNITPPRYFRGVSDEKERILRAGREELFGLADVPEMALADSEYNRGELEAAGFPNTRTLPIIVNLERLKTKPKRSILKRYGDGFVNLLFVGRVVPNKCFEDVILAFFHYKKYVNARSRLFLVGSFIGSERYHIYLQDLVQRLDLQDVIFAGHNTGGDLYAYYHLADVFLCMSEHEGFCVPLVESMFFGVPVVAYAAAAVPETLGGAGVLVLEKRHEEIAEMVDRLVNDGDFRRRIVEKQRDRLRAFETARLEERLMALLAPFGVGAE